MGGHADQRSVFRSASRLARLMRLSSSLSVPAFRRASTTQYPVDQIQPGGERAGQYGGSPNGEMPLLNADNRSPRQPHVLAMPIRTDAAVRFDLLHIEIHAAG